jgi:hypothetical protein
VVSGCCLKLVQAVSLAVRGDEGARAVLTLRIGADLRNALLASMGRPSVEVEAGSEDGGRHQNGGNETSDEHRLHGKNS